MIHRAGTRYHTQDARYYCGAAVAMMLLEKLGVSVTGKAAQRELYAQGSHYTTLPNYYIDPCGLVRMLNERLAAAGLSIRYEAILRGSAEVAVLELAARIAGTGLPAFTLEGRHWVLVDGVELDDDSLVVLNVFVHYPDVDASPPPPHGPTDVCGTFGHGLYDTALTPRPWSDSLTPLPEFNEQIALVLPVGPSSLVTPGLAEEPAAEDALPGWVSERFSGVTVSRRDWLTVRDTDSGASYQVAPLFGADQQVGWLTAMNGRRTGIALYPSPQNSRLATEVVARALAHRWLRSDASLAGPSELVWRSSVESPVRFLPFHSFEDGTIHVRLDGIVFRELTTLEKLG